MRDYKSSGSFTLRKRRRYPRGLITLSLIIIAIAAAGVVWIAQNPTPGASVAISAPATARPSSGRDLIPLKIPGQQPTASPEDQDN